MSAQADPVTLGSSAKIAWLQQPQQVQGQQYAKLLHHT
jgi:hypothetical protein